MIPIFQQKKSAENNLFQDKIVGFVITTELLFCQFPHNSNLSVASPVQHFQFIRTRITQENLPNAANKKEKNKTPKTLGTWLANPPPSP